PRQACEEAQIRVDVGDHAARSGAGGGVDVAHALREMILFPGTATIEGAEDLAAARHAVHLLRIARMEGHRHHRAVRLHPVVEPRPGLAYVAAHIEGAVLTSRRRAEARGEGARVLG